MSEEKTEVFAECTGRDDCPGANPKAADSNAVHADLVPSIMENTVFINFIKSMTQSLVRCEICGSQLWEPLLPDHIRNHYIDAGTSIINADGFQLPAPNYITWPKKGQRLMLQRYLLPVATVKWEWRSDRTYRHAVDSYRETLAAIDAGTRKPSDLKECIDRMNNICDASNRLGVRQAEVDYNTLSHSVVCD